MRASRVDWKSEQASVQVLPVLFSEQSLKVVGGGDFKRLQDTRI